MAFTEHVFILKFLS